MEISNGVMAFTVVYSVIFGILGILMILSVGRGGPELTRSARLEAWGNRCGGIALAGIGVAAVIIVASIKVGWPFEHRPSRSLDYAISGAVLYGLVICTYILGLILGHLSHRARVREERAGRRSV